MDAVSTEGVDVWLGEQHDGSGPELMTTDQDSLSEVDSLSLDAACSLCIEVLCEQEQGKCSASAECLDLFACLNECGVPGACEDKCVVEHPEAEPVAPDAIALFWCEYDACIEECAGPQ